MKALTICFFLALICLHQAVAKPYRTEGGNIHQRISSVPSRGGSAPKSLESGSASTIHRTIKTLHRSRRVASEDYGRMKPMKHTTEYPKHHLLQAIPRPNMATYAKSEIISTTAPYTENHHSWKKTKPVLLK